jgi:hypothetical protein
MAEKDDRTGLPDEIQRLRTRMTVLEQRVAHNEEAVPRSRAVAGGLGGGAMALLLSLSLPWVRGGGLGPGFGDDGGMRFYEDPRSVGTGWELLSSAFDDGRWLLVCGLVAVLLTALLAFAALFTERRGVHSAVGAAGWTLPVLLVLVWPHASSGPGVGGGPWVAAVASVVVALAGFWATSEIDRAKENQAVWEALGRPV